MVLVHFVHFCVINDRFTFLCMAHLRFKDSLIRIVIVVNNYMLLLYFVFAGMKSFPG